MRAGIAIAALLLAACAGPRESPPGDAARIASELKSLLPGLRVSVAGAKAVVEGELDSFDDYARVHPVLYDSQYVASIVNRVVVTQTAWARLATRITREIRSFAPGVRARAVNRQIWLEGDARSTDEGVRALKVAGLMLPEAIPPDPVASVDPRGDVLKVPPRATVQNFIVIHPK